MFGRIWSRTKAFFGRLFGRRAPEPGRFEPGRKFAFRGLLAVAPWIWPRRRYLVYVPKGHSRWRRTPLLVLIHGCRQTPEEIAAATRITTLADELACLVLLPRQNPRANPYGCWNWFDRMTAHGWGEAAIVAAQVRAVRRRYRVDRKRVFVAGMSSGGALAAVLGVRWPGLVAGVFVHSGIACGAASSAFTALGVLKIGADTNVERIAASAREHAEPATLPVPLTVVQGMRDDVVAPVNAMQLVRQYLALNGHPLAATGTRDELPHADATDVAAPSEGRVVTTREWRIAGHPVVRLVLVDGLGHAWSGGDDRYPYNDPRPPDATALLRAFVGDVVK